MATYCFKCPHCGRTTTAGIRENVYCAHLLNDGNQFGPTEMVRDYRAEAVGLTGMVDMKRERENGDTSKLFLPTNEYYAGPHDPDGHAGLRQWREEHQPKAENKRPKYPGDLPKRSF